MDARSTPPALDPSSFFAAALANWKPIVGTLVALVVLSVTAVLVSTYAPDRDLSAGVVFPQRPSASLPSLVHVSATVPGPEYTRAPASGAAVTLWRTPDGADAHNERAVVDALADGDLVKVDTGTTDAEGVAVLELPPVRPKALAEGAPEGAILLEEGASIGLVVTIDHAGERDVRRVTLDPADGFASALTLDRPIYQPGQRVLGRMLVVDSDSGAPASLPLTVTARDPSANVVFQEKLTSSDRGVASFELPLANPCPQGLYTMKVTSGDQTLTSRAFEVMPYRLPRFKVEVTPDLGTFGPDNPLTGAVLARYTTGDPVADADVLFTVSSVFPNGSTGSETLRGKTDSEGSYRFTWDASAAAPGSILSLSAEVTSAAGRAERGQGQAMTAGLDAAVSIVPLDRGSISSNSTNDVALIVRDATGAPLADTPVTVWAPQEGGEARHDGRTDARGRFVFSWNPEDSSNTVSVEVRDPSGENSVRRNVDVWAPYKENLFLEAPPTSPIDAKLELVVDASSEAQHLVMTRDGLVLGSQPLPPGKSKRTRLSLDLPPRARGLLSLRLVNAQGYERDRQQVWITQGDTSTVDIQTSKDTYSPGELAELSLSFPPAAGEPLPDDQTPVTYALVGVDEALYALRERPEPPLLVALGRAPRDVEAALTRLAGASDDLDARIARGEFARALADASREWSSNPQDLTYSINEANRSRRADTTAFLLAILTLLSMLAAARFTWIAISRSDFSARRLGGHFASGLAILPFVFVIGGVARDRGLIGALIVWGSVIAGWLFGAAWRERDPNLTRWGLATGLAAVLLVHVAVASSATSYAARPLAEATEFIVGAVAILAGLQVLLWPYRLWSRGHLAAGFGLGSFACICFAPCFMLFGTTVSEKFDAPTSMAKFAEAQMEEAPMDMDGRFGGEAANKPAPGKARADATGGDAPRTRSYFPETMVWLPELTSGADGVATTSFEVPDSITTWRLDAWANTWDGRLAQGRASIKVLKDFYAELDLPVDLTDGDDVLVPVSLVNRTDALQQVRLSVTTGGPLTASAPTQPIGVEPRSRAVALLRVRADGVGDATLTVTATTDAGPADAVLRPTRVAPDGRRLRASKTQPIGSGVAPTVSLPRDAIAGSALATLEVMPGAYADALESLDGMLRRPTGCFEQVSSANYPNAVVLGELARVGADAWPGGAEAHAEAVADAREFLALGYQKMLAYRRPDGSFGLYTQDSRGFADANGEILITAYGVMILDELSDHVHVDPEVVSRANQWLANKQKKDGSWPIYATRVSGGGWYDADDDIGQLRSTAFVAAALARDPDPKKYEAQLTRAMDRIAERAPFVSSPNALAWAATAALDARNTELAAQLLGRITSKLSRDEDLAWVASTRRTWMGGSSRWADIETTALTADALRRAGRGADVLPDLIAYLSASRSAYGGWGSTQATVWALRALTGVASQPDADVTLNVALNGAPMPRASQSGSTGQLELAKGDPRLYSFAAPGRAGDNTFDVRSTGPTRANLRATVSYAVPWTSPAARPAGALLSVTHEAPATLTFGQTAKARVVVKNTLADPTGALIVELPVPPGAWAPPAQFEDLARRGLIDRFELTPTHARLYVSGLAASATNAYAYTFVPLLRGAMSLPPARAYLFYTPDPVAEADGGDVQVR